MAKVTTVDLVETSASGDVSVRMVKVAEDGKREFHRTLIPRGHDADVYLQHVNQHLAQMGAAEVLSAAWEPVRKAVLTAVSRG